VAGVFTPVITTFPAPFLTVVSQDATTYDELQQSLTTPSYVAKGLQITSSSTEQVAQPILFESYDANGELANYTLTPVVDPYQFQRALEVDLSTQSIILDGKTKMNLQVLPNASSNLDFNVAQVSASGADDLGGALDDETLESLYNDTIFRGIQDVQESVEEVFDYDFMNRTGFFPTINTSLSDCYPQTLDDLFTDFKDEI